MSQLNVSCGQDSVSAIVPATIFLVNLSNSHIGQLPLDSFFKLGFWNLLLLLIIDNGKKITK
jgi:hypothetical protein